jgi:hypothetical protein
MSVNSFKNFSKSISKSIPMNSKVLNESGKTLTKAKDFLYVNIFTVVIIFFVLLVSTIFITVFNISFKNKDYVQGDAYIMEGLGGKPKNIKTRPKLPPTPSENAKAFVLKNKCKGMGINEMCKKNTDLKICNELDCCAWVNYKKGAKCVQGGMKGPSIKKYKDGKLGYDHYYYKNKKYDAKNKTF